jgi:hydroxylaminobenzene mutase
MEATVIKRHQSNWLIFLGIMLFFLGLIIGLVIPLMANPRMGVTSHVEGVLNGMFLIILGLIWHRIELSELWLKVTFWLSIYGTFANWLGVLMAAIFNAGKIMNVVSGGQKGPPVIEGIVTFLLITLSIAMLWICITILIGLRRYMKKEISVH